MLVTKNEGNLSDDDAHNVLSIMLTRLLSDCIWNLQISESSKFFVWFFFWHQIEENISINVDEELCVFRLSLMFEPLSWVIYTKLIEAEKILRRHFACGGYFSKY